MTLEEKKKIWIKESQEETIKLLSYIKNAKSNVLLLPNFDIKNDFAIGIGIAWSMLSIDDYMIFYKEWVKNIVDNTRISLVVKIERNNNPGVKFIEKDKKHLEMVVYSENENEDFNAKQTIFTTAMNKNFFNEASKKLNAKIEYK